MAKREVTIMTDDLDGTESKDITTVTFGLHGATYEIDLTKKNAKKLDDALSPFLGAARKASAAGRRSSASGARTDKEQLTAIREWARKNGHQVSDRGRIKQDVVDAYNAAN